MEIDIDKLEEALSPRRRGKKMTIQKAAYQILEERGASLPAEEIANTALKKGMVTSRAKDRVFSLVTTLLKNIREGTYNQPELCSMMDENGRRLIGLPTWNQQDKSTNEVSQRIIEEVDIETFKKIMRAGEAGLGTNHIETISRLVDAGFRAYADEILLGLSRKHDEKIKEVERLLGD